MQEGPTAPRKVRYDAGSVNLRSHLLGAALLLGACTDPLPSPAPAAPTEDAKVPPRATLSAMRGPVSIKRAAGDEWLKAQVGMALHADDKISPGAGGTATLSFTAGGTMDLAENALVGLSEPRALHQQRATDVTVHRGRVEATLPNPEAQTLSVETPAAVITAGREVGFQ